MIEKPKTQAEKTTHTTVDTISFTVKEAHQWEVPQDIQRGVRVNKKVMELATQIKNDGGVLPGIITLGVLDRKTYLIDGQQRREAFFISEHLHGFADVRTCFFKTRAEMGEEFVRLNSALVKMTPDDILRGLEVAVPLLRKIRSSCPFVGYGRIRAGGNSVLMLSMSMTLRCWGMSRREVPGSISASGHDLARELQDEEANKLILFLLTAFAAWDKDESYWRLWGGMNLTTCMWVFRRIVTDPPTNGIKRSVKLSVDDFRKGLLALSADRSYLDWLVGRSVGERDRAPCYNRVKAIFAKRISEETGKKILLPQPEWSH